MLVVAGQVGVALVGLSGLRILTTFLPPAEFGRLALGMSLAALLQQLAFGPLAVATLRYAGAAWDSNEFRAFVADVDRLLALSVAFSVGAGLLAAAVVLAFGLTHWVSFGALCLWYASGSGIFTTRLSLDAALRRRGWVAGAQVLSEAGRFGLAAGLLAWFHVPSASYAMTGFALAATVAALVQRSRAPGEVHRRAGHWAPRLTLFSKPLAVTGALTWAQMASDRWSLNALLSTAHVGAYSVIYQIAVAPFTLVGTMIQQLIGPIVFRMAGSGEDRDLVRASHVHVLLAVGLLLGATAVGALVAWQFHAFIFGLLVGPGYAGYSRLLPLGVVAGGLLAAAQVVATTVLSRGATQQLVVPKAVTALLGLVLNIAGAKLYGVVGVLCANAIFGLLFFLWMYAIASGPRAPASAPIPVAIPDPLRDMA